MTEPQAIVPFAVYSSEQVCAVLQIGQDKLKVLVAAGDLSPLSFTARHRFFGEDLVRLCRLASESEWMTAEDES
jgi:hypothetical protein